MYTYMYAPFCCYTHMYMYMYVKSGFAFNKMTKYKTDIFKLEP